MSRDPMEILIERVGNIIAECRMVVTADFDVDKAAMDLIAEVSMHNADPQDWAENLEEPEPSTGFWQETPKGLRFRRYRSYEDPFCVAAWADQD
mgnify:CR=1 FL=1|jgi:hypothetical protein